MTEPRSYWPLIETKGRLFGYARVSTADQKLRMQKDALSAIECCRIFEDRGISGARSSRPGLDAMLDVLEAGDTVVVFKLDRLGRSVSHLADLLVRFQNTGIGFVSLSEGINTTTPGGKLVYHLFSAFAEFQRDVIIENTLAGVEAARRRGKTLGRPRLLSIEAVLEAHRQIHQNGVRTDEIAARLGVSRMTLSRALGRIDKPSLQRAAARMLVTTRAGRYRQAN